MSIVLSRARARDRALDFFAVERRGIADDPGIVGLVGPPAVVVERPLDVVMIGNRNAPRLRGLTDWRDRIRFVDELQDRFDDRFAVYDRSWGGPSTQWPIPYSERHRAVHSGWVSANWDCSATEPKCFSDRPPTSQDTGTVACQDVAPRPRRTLPQRDPRLLAIGPVALQVHGPCRELLGHVHLGRANRARSSIAELRRIVYFGRTTSLCAS